MKDGCTFLELIEHLKTGVCKFTGKQYDCARCTYKHQEHKMQPGIEYHFTMHMSLSIAGYVERNAPLREYNRIARCCVENLTGAQARQYFLQLYGLGVRVLPIDDCSSFCYVHGCAKHPQPADDEKEHGK